MKRFLSLLATGALALGLSSTAHAQLTRPFGAGALVLDDLHGHKVTLEAPVFGSPEGNAWSAIGYTPLTWSIPVPPMNNAQSGFLFAGPLSPTIGPYPTTHVLTYWLHPNEVGFNNSGGSAGAWDYATTTQLGIPVLAPPLSNTANIIPKTDGAGSFTSSSLVDDGAVLHVNGNTVTVDETLGNIGTIGSYSSTNGNITLTNGALSVGGTSTLTGNTTVGGTLGVTGLSTLTGGASMGGNIAMGGNSITNALNVTATGAFTGGSGSFTTLAVAPGATNATSATITQTSAAVPAGPTFIVQTSGGSKFFTVGKVNGGFGQVSFGDNTLPAQVGIHHSATPGVVTQITSSETGATDNIAFPDASGTVVLNTTLDNNTLPASLTTLSTSGLATLNSASVTTTLGVGGLSTTNGISNTGTIVSSNTISTTGGNLSTGSNASFGEVEIADGFTHFGSLETLHLSGPQTYDLPDASGNISLTTTTGGTALFTGPTVSRTYTLPDAAATLMYNTEAAGGDLGGTYPSPTVTSVADVTTGTLAVGNGGTGTGTAFTAGSVVFAGASGVYTQNNANFYWNNATNRLLIGTGSTVGFAPLDVVQSGGSDVLLGGGATTGSEIKFLGTNHLSIYNAGGNFTFANTSSLAQTNTAPTTTLATLNGSSGLLKAFGGLDANSNGLAHAGAISGGTAITSSGTIIFSGLGDGVVHATGGTGTLASSLIVNADITPGTIQNGSLQNSSINYTSTDGSINVPASTALGGTTNLTVNTASVTLAGDVTGPANNNVANGSSAATFAVANAETVGGSLGVMGATTVTSFNATGDANINITGGAATTIGNTAAGGAVSINATDANGIALNGATTLTVSGTADALKINNTGTGNDITGSSGNWFFDNTGDLIIDNNGNNSWLYTDYIGDESNPTVQFESTVDMNGNALTDQGGGALTLNGSGNGIALGDNTLITGTLGVSALSTTAGITNTGSFTSTGDANINISGGGATTIGNDATPSTTTIAGSVNIGNATAANAINIGNTNSTTDINGTVNINGSPVVSGSGTINTLPIFTATGSTIGNSGITETGGIIQSNDAINLGDATHQGIIRLYNGGGTDVTIAPNGADILDVNNSFQADNNINANTGGFLTAGVTRISNAGAATLTGVTSSGTIIFSGLGNGVVHATLGNGTLASTLIVNADVNAAAGIVYSKLNLTGSIVNGDLAGGVYAAITGLGAQSQALNMNTHQINGVVDPTSAQDAATKFYVDGLTGPTHVVTSFSAPGTGLTPNSASTGVVALGGTLNIATGGTNSGAALTGSGAIMVENGTSIVQGSAGTTTTVLHGNAGGVPTYGSIVNADLTSTTYSNITGIGAQSQALNMNGNNITGGGTITGTSLTATTGGASITNAAGAALTLSATGGNDITGDSWSVDGSGNLTAASLTSAGTITFSGIGGLGVVHSSGGGALSSSLIVNADLTSTTYSNITGIGTQSQALNMNSNAIHFLANPVIASDAANKGYVDGLTGPTHVVTSFSAAGTGLTPNSASTGIVALGGTLNIATGGTNSGAALTGSGAIMVENGTSIVQGAAGTTTTVLHGNAGGAPTYGAVATGDIANNAVSYAQFQQVAASSLVGNPTGVLANAEGITLGTSLAFTGTVLNTIQDIRSTATPTFGGMTLNGDLGMGTHDITGTGQIDATTFSAGSPLVTTGLIDLSNSGSGNVAIVQAAPQAGTDETYTIPDAGAAASFILSTSTGGQTIAGGLTSSGTFSASGAGGIRVPEGQLALGTQNSFGGEILFDDPNSTFVGDLTIPLGGFTGSNHTWTLPDASGTIALQGGAGSFTTLTSSGNSTLGTGALAIANSFGTGANGNAVINTIGSTGGGTSMTTINGATTLAALTNGVVHATGGTGLLASSAIINTDVSPTAGITYSKLNLSGSIVNGDLAGGSYGAITGVGTLTAGATGTGFTVDLGSSTITGTLPLVNGGTGQDNSTGIAANSFFASPSGGSGGASFRTITNADIASALGAGGSAGSFTTLTSSGNSTLGTGALAIANSFGTGANGNAVINTIGSTGGGTSMTTINGATTLAALTNGVVHATGGTGLLASSAIINTDVSPTAGITYSKLNLSGSIVNGDLAGGSYGAITGVGTLTAGATGTGFTVDLGSSTITGTLPLVNGGTGQDNSTGIAANSFFASPSGGSGGASFRTITNADIASALGAGGSAGSFTTLTSSGNSTLGTGALAIANSFGTGANGNAVINTIGSTGGGTSMTTINGATTLAALTNGVVHATGGTGLLASSAIINTDVSPTAGITYSKLNLSGSIVNGDLAGGSYGAITGVGTLTAGATGTGFTVDLGSSTITGTLPLVNGGTGQDNSTGIAANSFFASPSGGSGGASFRTITNADIASALGAGGSAGSFTTLTSSGNSTLGTGALAIANSFGTGANGNAVINTIGSTGGGTSMTTINGATTLAALTNGVVHATGGTGLLASSAIINTDVSPTAGITYSKLNLSGSIVNGDLAGGSYGAITGVGTLTAGATGTGFTVDLGSSTITGTLPLVNGGTGQDNSTGIAANSFFASPSGGSGGASFRTITNADIASALGAGGSAGSFTTLTSSGNSTLGTGALAIANSFGTGANGTAVINTIGSTGGGTSLTTINGSVTLSPTGGSYNEGLVVNPSTADNYSEVIFAENAGNGVGLWYTGEMGDGTYSVGLQNLTGMVGTSSSDRPLTITTAGLTEIGGGLTVVGTTNINNTGVGATTIGNSTLGGAVDIETSGANQLSLNAASLGTGAVQIGAVGPTGTPQVSIDAADAAAIYIGTSLEDIQIGNATGTLSLLGGPSSLWGVTSAGVASFGATTITPVSNAVGVTVTNAGTSDGIDVSNSSGTAGKGISVDLSNTGNTANAADITNSSTAASGYAGVAITMSNGTATATGPALELTNGHLDATQAANPLGGAVTGHVASASTSAASTDVAGEISLTMDGTGGTGSGAIAFSKDYGTAPFVVLTPADAATATILATSGYYVTPSTTGFTVTFIAGFNGAPTTTYSFYYHVIE